jgi:hypothetical protein
MANESSSERGGSGNFANDPERASEAGRKVESTRKAVANEVVTRRSRHICFADFSKHLIRASSGPFPASGGAPSPIFAGVRRILTEQTVQRRHQSGPYVSSVPAFPAIPFLVR